MAEFNVVVTGEALHADALAILNEIANVTFTSNRVTESDLVKLACEIQVHGLLVRNNPVLGQALLTAAPALRVIAKHGVGVDSIDLDAAARRHIPVLITTQANAFAVAEHALALMLGITHNIGRLSERFRAGHFDTAGYMGIDLQDRVVGVLGYGRIGQRVAMLTRAIGARVIAYDPIAPITGEGIEAAAKLDDVLTQADVVSLHLPLLAETKHLIDAARIARMKPGAIIVNTARGGLIDEPALVDGLVTGKLSGAALDVLDTEPPPADHPLRNMSNVIVTPHIAAFTTASFRRMGVFAAEGIKAALTGGVCDSVQTINAAQLAKYA
jgi:D-3-phosphoglycerate dehydrogenase